MSVKRPLLEAQIHRLGAEKRTVGSSITSYTALPARIIIWGWKDLDRVIATRSSDEMCGLLRTYSQIALHDSLAPPIKSISNSVDKVVDTLLFYKGSLVILHHVSTECEVYSGCDRILGYLELLRAFLG